MMIIKHKLEASNDTKVLTYEGAETLCVRVNGGNPCVYQKVDLDRPTTHTTFQIRGASLRGDEERYVGTFELFGSNQSWHVFERVT
jgi:hypothetical protein